MSLKFMAERVAQGNRLSYRGAPSQHSQSSRKGKRAWRKNVDIDEVEHGLEELREEERVLGAPLHKKADEELFTIDLTGDDKIRRQVKTSKPLTASVILAQRSAVPAVTSKRRQDLKKFNVTREEKERLRRIAHKPRAGPFNSVLDSSEVGHGSALLEPSEAVKNSGTYDVWTSNGSIPTGGVPRKIAPRHTEISVPAVSTPHQGTSYNPPLTDYRNLLQEAHEREERRVEEEERLKEIKQKMDAARYEVGAQDKGGAEGMLIDDATTVSGDEEGSLQEESVMPSRTPTRRKTPQQRRKALRVLEEHQQLKARAARKKMLVTLDRAKSLAKEIDNARTEHEREEAERKLERLKQLHKGLMGTRVGKHRVIEPEVDVQLGEDLAETLTGLKTEGNLFRDRFLSMQNRALIEPRARVAPTRRKHKVKELEKFAWKRFS